MKIRDVIATVVVLATLLALPHRALGRGCLAKDTPILTPTGEVAVQDLKVGDAIWSIDAGGLHPAKVMARYEVIADEMLELVVAGRRLRVTPEHPMRTARGIFVEAGKLHPGDHLWLWDGTSLDEVSINSIHSAKTREPAFNIMVSPGGTYLADGIAVHNKGCFLPETPVLRADGSEAPIASIRPGDRLKAFTPEGEIVTATVQEIVTHEVDEYCRVTTDHLALDVTAEHPFFVGDGTFKTLEALNVGDEIYAYDGHGLSPQKIVSIEHIARHVTVYNLQTNEPHTFFAHGVAVHNKGGGGGHGGGGHSGGGGFYGGGGHYYGGSSTQPSQFAGLICPVAFILIFVLLIVYRVLHSMSSFSNSSSTSSYSGSSRNLDFVYSRTATDPKVVQTTKLLEHLAQRDARVAPAALSDLVRSTFIQLQKCWEARNYTPMQPLLMPDLYRSHAMQLAAMVKQHEINHIANLAIERIDLVHIRYTSKPEQREFTALITASARDYFTDDRGGRFIRGDQATARFQEFWIFHYLPDRWLLREIEQSRESGALSQLNFVDAMNDQQIENIAGPLPKPVGASWAESRVLNKVSRVDALLDSLAKRDAMWDKTAMLSRARDVFVVMTLAVESGDTSQAAAEVSPTGLAKLEARCAHLRQSGETVEFRNLCVRKVDVVLVQYQANKLRSEFTARIAAHAQQVHNRAGAVVAQDDAELPFIQFLSFGWFDEKWKLKDILSAAQGSAALNSMNTSLSMAQP